MNELLRASVLAIVTAASVVACGAQQLDGGSRQTMFVRAALGSPVERAGATCVYSAATPTLFSGVLDVGLRDDFKLSLLVQTIDGTPPTSITDAHVTVRTDDKTLADFDVVTTGFVDATGPGVVSLTAIDARTAGFLLHMLTTRTDALALVVEVELRGREPASGHGATTPLFRFPVKACNGCLVDFSTGNDPLQRPSPNCLKFSSQPTPTPCNFGQDDLVKCELCIGMKPACDPKTP